MAGQRVAFAIALGNALHVKLNSIGLFSCFLLIKKFWDCKGALDTQASNKLVRFVVVRSFSNNL